MKNDNKGTGKRGRDPKISPQIADLFAREISLGRTKKQAALLVGIHPTTVSVWLRRGREEGRKNVEYNDFAKKVAKAEAVFIASRLDEILKAAKPKRTKAVKRTVRNTYDLDGTLTGTLEVIEETTKREQEWMAAWKLLERKDRENWGDHAEEIREIKRKIAEFEKEAAERRERAGSDHEPVPAPIPATAEIPVVDSVPANSAVGGAGDATGVPVGAV